MTSAEILCFNPAFGPQYDNKSNQNKIKDIKKCLSNFNYSRDDDPEKPAVERLVYRGNIRVKKIIIIIMLFIPYMTNAHMLKSKLHVIRNKAYRPSTQASTR